MIALLCGARYGFKALASAASRSTISGTSGKDGSVYADLCESGLEASLST